MGKGKKGKDKKGTRYQGRLPISTWFISSPFPPFPSLPLSAASDRQSVTRFRDRLRLACSGLPRSPCPRSRLVVSKLRVRRNKKGTPNQRRLSNPRQGAYQNSAWPTLPYRERPSSTASDRKGPKARIGGISEEAERAFASRRIVWWAVNRPRPKNLHRPRVQESRSSAFRPDPRVSYPSRPHPSSITPLPRIPNPASPIPNHKSQIINHRSPVPKAREPDPRGPALCFSAFVDRLLRAIQ
jgi:hypothetical protein